MTTREVYFKAYVHSTKPLGMLFFMFNKDGKPRIGNTPWLEFSKESHEDNIEIMKLIEKNADEFMFWNISDDGDNYIKTQSKKIGEVLSTLAFMQK